MTQEILGVEHSAWRQMKQYYQIYLPYQFHQKPHPARSVFKLSNEKMKTMFLLNMSKSRRLTSTFFPTNRFIPTDLYQKIHTNRFIPKNTDQHIYTKNTYQQIYTNKHIPTDLYQQIHTTRFIPQIHTTKYIPTNTYSYAYSKSRSLEGPSEGSLYL